MSEQNSGWFRDQLLPPATPPAGQLGMLGKWRRTLFDSWGNGVLTLVTVGVLAAMVWAIFPWLAHSVWDANSLAQCRAQLHGEAGACWGVIRDRWQQLLFGFYPSDQYWRPVAAFGLMLLAIAPLLFSRLPKAMLRFTIMFPGLAFWLIWGGTLWVAAGIYAGFFLFGLVFKVVRSGPKSMVRIATLIALAVWLFYGVYPCSALLSQIAPLSLQPVSSRELGGFLLSIVIGVSGIALSLPLGVLVALGRRSSLPLIRVMSVTFIEFIRGVPLITLLFTASLLLNYFLPPGTSFDLIVRVIIMVTLFATAYMAEVIRGGLAALPPGQYEAAEALGLDYWKAQRLVIMPQALKISIPMIVSTFIGLFKDTTLVVFIGLLDPIALSTAIRASTDWQGIYWELFIFIGALFFVFCYGMSRYSIYLERQLKTDHR